MKSKKGPLGTPLGNPLKYFNDLKASRSISKAKTGRIIPGTVPRNPFPSDPKTPTNTIQGELTRHSQPTNPDRVQLVRPTSFSKPVDPGKLLQQLEAFKNRPMKKGGSVKRKKK